MKKLKLDELGRVAADDFKEQMKFPIVLVLDNLRSALNVGSAFRTADGFALEKIVLCGISATPPHREILKTALGATDSVEWVHFDSVTTALEELKSEDYQVLAVEQTDSSVFLQDFLIEKNKKYALVFGNEVEGVSDEAMALCETAIEIPQYGTKHSFNVSVCLGIVSWEFVRRLVE
jgi:23S rRNA (guanosine2251-2'-O)-methyltransferase